MKKLFFIVFIITSVGCKTTVSTDAKDSSINMSDFKTVSKGMLFGDGEEGINKSTLIIRDKKAWEMLTTRMNTVNKVSESFKELPIDFSKEIVVAVFDQVRTSGGFDATIFQVQYINGETKIVYTIEKPKATDMVTTVMTQPYHLIKLRKREGTITIINEDQE